MLLAKVHRNSSPLQNALDEALSHLKTHLR
jgi:hypothetical protein